MSDIFFVDPERNFNLKYCLPQKKNKIPSNNTVPSIEVSAHLVSEKIERMETISQSHPRFSTSEKSNYNAPYSSSSKKHLFTPPYVPDISVLDRSAKLKKYSILLALVSTLLILSSFPLLFSHNHYKECIVNNTLSPVQTYIPAQSNTHSSESSAFSLISMKISHFFNNYSAFNDGFDLWKSSTEYVNLKPRDDLSNSTTISTTTSSQGSSTNGITSSTSFSSFITTTTSPTSTLSTSSSETSFSVTSSSSSSSTFFSSPTSQSSLITSSLVSTSPTSTSFSSASTSISSEISLTSTVPDTASSSFSSTNVASVTTSDSSSSSQDSESSTTSPTVTSDSDTASTSGSVVVLGITSTETFSRTLSTLTVSSTAATAKPTLTSESSTSYSKGLSPKSKRIVIGCVVGIVGGFLFMALVAFVWYKFYYLRNHPKYVNSEGFWVDKNVETNNAVVLDNSSYDNVNIDNGQVGDRYNS